jgi:hypothetical protein
LAGGLEMHPADVKARIAKAKVTKPAVMPHVLFGR